MRRQAERRRTCRTGMEQWRTVEMGVADGARPDRRQRHQMREVQRVDQGLPDARVNLPWQRQKPRLDRIDAFSSRRAAGPVDDQLDHTDLEIGRASWWGSGWEYV